MTYTAPVLGLLAGLAGIADTIPYVRDTVRGSTRPHRGTWLIWSVLAVIRCLSQRADGASWSLIMAAAQAVLTSAVFVLSIRRGATFALASLSGALAAGAVSVLDPSLLLYPAYYCLANGAIAVLIHFRRKLLASQQRISAPAGSLR